MNSNVICEAARDLWLPFHLFASLAVVYVTIQKIRCYGELAWNLIGAGIALVVLAFANPSYWICRESGESPAPVGSSSPAPTPEPTPTAQPTPTPTPAPKPPAEPPRLPDWLPIAGFVLAGVLAAALIALAVWWLTRHVISWIRKRREQRAERKASEAQALRWRAQARDVVEAIQQQIGEDRCDPLFVLENGAFFDIKVHPSRMFFAALTAWEDNQASYTPDEAAKAAAETAQARTYTIDDIITDGCFLEIATIRQIRDQLQRKKNIILQGPPGTGKNLAGKAARLCPNGARGEGAYPCGAIPSQSFL